MTTPRQNPRSRFLAPAAGVALALLAAACFGGCFVSFDGYELAAGGGAANGAEGGARGGATAVAGGGGQSNAAGGSDVGGALSTSGTGGATGVGGTAGPGGSTAAGSANAGAGGAAASAGSAAGGSAGNAGGAPQSCPTDSLGRLSDEIPLPTSGIYCIDRLEVRNKDYAAFLATNPSTSGQSAACAFNTDFLPATTGGCDQYDPNNKPNSPVACVDWCDAEKFCESVGKHLCGKIGGGANAPADFADATKSEWFRACSHAGDYDFPYGNVYQGDACGGLENLAATNPLPVPNSSCLGGYDALWDMSGNVSEWENSCSGSTGASDLCLYRGGSYLDTNKTVGAAPSLLCNSNIHGAPKSASKARSTRDKEIGFRCCLEL